jgi:putative protein-disulfide isomerase
MNSKPRLYYIADPLCGWSYGFTPIFSKIYEAYKDSVDWEYLVGGMAVGEHAKPMPEVASHMRAAVEAIRERTGAHFGKAFYDSLLNKTDEHYDSAQACAALVYLKNQTTAATWLQILSAIHHGIFVEGLAPNSTELLARATAVAKIPADGLLAAIQSPENLEKLKAEFAKVKQLNVTSFPALVLEQPDGHIYPVIEGYTSYDRTHALLDRLLAARLSLS